MFENKKQKFLKKFEFFYNKTKNQKSVGKNLIPIEKLVLNIMEIYSSGNFRGTISIKMEDNDIFSPRIEENTQWNRTFEDLDQIE